MQRRSALRLSALIPLFAATILASCGQDSVVGPRIASLAIVSGSGQSTPVGSTLPAPLVVIVVDQSGVPVEGASITWSVVSGGGTVTPGTSTTGADGKASASLRVGNSTGSVTVRAALGTLQPVLFLATAVAAPPTKLVIAGGDLQTGTVGLALATNISVLLTDAVDTPKQGVLVTFTVSTGGGTLSAGSAVTDASGIATVRWTLGTITGVQTVIAFAAGITPLTFTATAAAGAPNALTIISGNNQTGSPGATLPDSLRVRLVDKFGNGIAGVAIAWTPGTASGTVSPISSLTDVNGRAATKWTLGSTGGQTTVAATGGGFVQQFTGGGSFNYLAVSAGAKHSCGLAVGGVAYCWGYNGDGQLGTGLAAAGSGPVFAFPQPAATTGNLTFSQLIGGSYHTCALTLSGVGQCWGVNVDGRLGIGSVLTVNAPTQIVATRAFTSMSNGQAHSCALDLSDLAFCWGRNVDGQGGLGLISGSVLVPTEVTGGTTYGALAAGGLHTCAVQKIGSPFTNGPAWCWGNNQAGQLGDAGANPTGVNVPVAVSGGKNFSAIAAGELHTCAIDGAGAAWCWGGDASGQLGDSPANLPGANQNIPVAVGGGKIFRSIAAGRAHTCAITTGNQLYCWGANESGQLGDGSTTTRTAPTLVPNILFASVSTGNSHTCAVSTANIAYCWGDNQFGQLGDGTVVSRTSPNRVAFQP